MYVLESISDKSCSSILDLLFTYSYCTMNDSTNMTNEVSREEENLRNASRDGDVEAVRRILEERTNPNNTDDEVF